MRTTSVLVLVLAGTCMVTSACASSPGGDGDGDAGIADAGLHPDARVRPDAGVSVELRTGWCSGGGWLRGEDGTRGVACFGPADVASKERRLGTDRWRPGPIYRVAP